MKLYNLKKTIALALILLSCQWAWAQEPVFSQWNGTVPAIPANTNVATVNAAGITGSGTEASPFLIDSADDFAFFWAAACNGKITSSAQYWRLDANIDLNNQAWTYFDKNGTFKGKFNGNGKIIKNMTLTTNAANKCFGLFPQVQGENATKHAEIKNLTITGFTISTPDKNTSYGGTTNVGLLAGKLNGNVDIENVTVSGGTIAYNVTTTGANNVGCLAGQITSDNNTITRCTVKNGAAITTASGADAAKKNNFMVGGLAGNISNNTLIKGNTVTVSITLNGETSGNNYAGGLIGYASGSNSTVTAELPMGKRIVVKGNTVTPTIAMNGVVTTATLSVGGFIGYINNHVNVFNNKVTSPNISVTNDINNNSYVGGAIGFMSAYSYVDGMTVSNGSISGPTSADQIVKNNIVFFVGGFLGYQNSSGTGVFQANKFKNVAVTDVDINLGRYVAGGNISNTKFGIGGIAGSINQPNMQTDGNWNGMPENIIFKGGKIYAPYATTSPTVSSFNASNPAHNTMTLDAVTTVDAIEKAKVKTWYYSDYKLGLSSAFLSSESVIAYGDAAAKDKYHKNYTATPAVEGGISYLTVNNSTFQKQNRYQDSERDSKTVLWWTRTDNYNATTAAPFASFTNEEQPIYPNNGAVASTAYPYYWYFFQGVSNANYANATDAGNIIRGITANIDNDVMPAVAVGTASNLTVTITNDGATRRGFDARILTVKVMQGETDVTANYTYQWYVDGVADGTAGPTTSKSFTAHWKDTKGITINVIKDATTVYATASYGFGPGVLHTKSSLADASAEKVRSDINKRGTKDNPYIIDCESALRQLSLLSTSHTNTLWEGIVKPVSPFPTNQIAGHYNRAYYELGADINMTSTPFVPISHVGYGGDGTWGTYNGNFMFQGVFDGKGHKISNLKITWGAGQYNGNNTNIYYGLFGAVGNTVGTAAAVAKWGESSASNTVIKNLVIDGATLTHDVNNTTFSYRKDYSHITSDNGNNCMVGVLAGVVGGYTDIQNIEIRGSKITDETTTSNYNLAKMGLYVGGAIGSVQCAFNQTGNVPTGTVIQHIAAQVDITLRHAAFACPDNDKKVAEMGQFNVGGIIGRYIATNATAGQPDAAMPKYTLYSGTIDATKAWISPVLAALRYKDQQANNDWKNYSKQWEGNNNTAATQVKITNAQYYKFKIGTTDITDVAPANTCGFGFRTLTAHVDATENATDYVAQKYQGVNYGAKNIAAKEMSLELLNTNRPDEYNFVWDDSDDPTAFVHLTTEKYLELSLTRDAEVNNKFTATMKGGTPDSYTWSVSFDGVNNWHDVATGTSNEYIVPVSLKTKYVRATTTVNGKTYTTLFETVEADKNLCNPEITYSESDGNAILTFNLNQKDADPKATFTTTYEWYKTKTEIIPEKVTQTLTLEKSEFEGSAYNKVAFCKATVSEHGEKVGEFFIIYGATVVYVKGNGGEDNVEDEETHKLLRTRGWTPETPVKTIDEANRLLRSEAEGGTVDNNIIVIMGLLNENYVFHSSGANPATLTGYYNNTDYNGVIRIKQIFPGGGEHCVNQIDSNPKSGTNCYVLGDTKFENLTFYGMQEGNSFIELHGHDAIFGKGLVMQNFKKLSSGHGNFGEREEIPEFTIILYATNLSQAKIDEYINRIYEGGKPQTVTFQSGHYGRLMAGRFTQEFFYGTQEANKTKWEQNTAYSILGSAAKPVWAVVNVEIDKDNEQTDKNGKTYTRDVNAIIAGLTDGSMYGDYTINFYGGNVAYIVGANQGNAINNGGVTYTPVGGTSGKWGQWPNASYFGRTVINVDDKSGTDSNIKPITVGNLYAGGLGRKVQSGDQAYAAVDMYMYGRTEVNVKSGTVSGSVYGGGVGGVIGVSPWDAHLPYKSESATTVVDNAIHNGVQYGDERQGNWSTKKADSEMAKVKLHNLKADGSGYDEENCDLRNSSTTVNIFAGNVNGNVYGGGYGFVQDMPEGSTVQGVGSVFGTSNINISGGNILGNVFGGSQGDIKYYNKKNKYGQTITHIAEMNGTVNMHITGRPTIGGDIFGGGQGISSLSAEEEYLRIATTGNEDLAGSSASEEAKDKFRSNVNIIIELDENSELSSNVYGGGMMGAVDGTTNIVIRSGQINGNVYGGGKGEKGHLQKARVKGTTNVTIGY